MRIHTIEHVPFEGPGAIAVYAEKGGHTLTRTRIFAGESLPQPDAIDLLAVMGGPMSVHDAAILPWLQEEKAYLREAVRTRLPILGVCLGAQLLAEVLGGHVTRCPSREIGWHPVRITPGGKTTSQFVNFPKKFPAFHWHGETFTIPPGATWAAESDGCAHQAFVARDRIVGLQFHLETLPENMELLITHCGDELVPQTAFVQAPEDMRTHAGTSDTLQTAQQCMNTLLNTMTGN